MSHEQTSDSSVHRKRGIAAVDLAVILIQTYLYKAKKNLTWQAGTDPSFIHTNRLVSG